MDTEQNYASINPSQDLAEILQQSINSEKKSMKEKQSITHKGSSIIQNPSIDALSQSSLNQFDELQTKMRLAVDNKSIFSELTDKKALLNTIQLQQLKQANALQEASEKENFVNEDFQYVYDDRYNYSSQANPIILENVPLMQRPSQLSHFHQQKRPQTQNKQRIKKSIFNDKYALSFSLFPQGESKKEVFKKNLLKQKQQTLSNDQNLIEYFNSIRSKHAQSEQRSRHKNRNSFNKVFAPIQTDMHKQHAGLEHMKASTMSTAASQHNNKRAQSSQTRLRQNTNFIQITNDEYSQNQFNTEQDSMFNGQSTFDARSGIDSVNYQTRPTTAVGVVRQRKILQTLQQQQSRGLQLKESNTQQPLDLKRVLEDLKGKQAVDSSDILQLSILDKIQQRNLQVEEVTEDDQILAINPTPKKKLNTSYNPYKNEQSIQEEVSSRLQRRQANNLIFKQNRHKNEDSALYEHLKDILEEGQDQDVTYMKLFEIKKIQDQLDSIQTSFFSKKLGTGTNLMNRSFNATSTKSRTRIKVHTLNTTNKMEPMSLGPFTKTDKELKTQKQKQIQELTHGYAHTGSPFDHPYQAWMEGLRKNKQTSQNIQIDSLKKEQDDIQYQKYLTEVKALNIVKDFLSENRDKLSQEHKTQLINQILNAQKRLKMFEKLK